MSAFRSRDRVRISDAYARVVESLGEKTDAARVFENQAQAVVFAASVGYHFNRFSPVTGRTSKAILFQQINQATDLGADLVAIFALARTGDLGVIAPRSSEDEAEDVSDPVLIFEGYVNGGLSYILKQDFDAANPIKAVRDLVRTLNPERSDIFGRS